MTATSGPWHLKKDREEEEAIKILCLLSATYVICMDTAVVAVLSGRVTDNLGKNEVLLSLQFSQFSKWIIWHMKSLNGSHWTLLGFVYFGFIRFVLVMYFFYKILPFPDTFWS